MLTYSPGVVLVVWAVAVGFGLDLGREEVIPFLLAEGASVIGYIEMTKRRLG